MSQNSQATYRTLAPLESISDFDAWLSVAVYDDQPNRLAIVERVPSAIASDTAVVKSIFREIKQVSRLEHAGLAPSRGMFRSQDEYFFGRDFVAGESLEFLRHQFQQRGATSIPIAMTVRAIAEIAAAFAEAERQLGGDAIHAQIHPGLLFINYSGSAIVAGHGLHKLQHAIAEKRGGIGGARLNYSAPEQCQGGEIDARTDIFSLGVVLWEMLTLKSLFGRSAPYEVMQAICEERVARPSSINPDIPSQLDSVCTRALQKDPKRRYQNWTEVLSGLEALLQLPDIAGESMRVAQRLQESFPQRRELWGRVEDAEQEQDWPAANELVQKLQDAERIQQPEPFEAQAAPTDKQSEDDGELTDSDRRALRDSLDDDLVGQALGEDRGTSEDQSARGEDTTVIDRRDERLADLLDQARESNEKGDPTKTAMGLPNARFDDDDDDDLFVADSEQTSEMSLTDQQSGEPTQESDLKSPFEDETAQREPPDEVTDKWSDASVTEELDAPPEADGEFQFDDESEATLVDEPPREFLRDEVSETTQVDEPPSEFLRDEESETTQVDEHPEPDTEADSPGANGATGAAESDQDAFERDGDLHDVLPDSSDVALTSSRQLGLPGGVSLGAGFDNLDWSEAFSQFDDADEEYEDDEPAFDINEILEKPGSARMPSQESRASRCVMEIVRLRDDRVLKVDTLQGLSRRFRSDAAPFKANLKSKFGVVEFTRKLGVDGRFFHRNSQDEQGEPLPDEDTLELRPGDSLELVDDDVTYRVRVFRPPHSPMRDEPQITSTKIAVYAIALLLAIAFHGGGLLLVLFVDSMGVSLTVEEKPKQAEVFAEGELKEPDKPEEKEPEPPKPPAPTPKPEPADPTEQEAQLPESVQEKIDKQINKKTSASAAKSKTENALDAIAGGPEGDSDNKISNIDAVKSKKGSGGSDVSIRSQLGSIGGDEPTMKTGGGGSLQGAGGDVSKDIGKLAKRSGKKKVRGKVSGQRSASKVTGGTLSRSDVYKTINKYIGSIQRCYERELMSDPSLGGKITFEWTVTTNGSVKGVRERSSTLNSRKVSSCIIRVIKRMKFPSPKGGEAEIAYPFNFESQ